MLASVVLTTKASIMYGAVYHFGPRREHTIQCKRMPAAKVPLATLMGNIGHGDEMIIVNPGQPAKDITWYEFMRDKEIEGLEVLIRPSPSRLKQSNFTALKTAIIEKNLTLEEIENFVPNSEIKE